METANNTTMSLNETTFTNPESAPILLTTIMLSFCAWITTINALVLTCLVTSKRALNNFVNIQILGFSLTDMLVGISSIPLTLTFQITKAFPTFEACAGIFYAYCTSQTSNLVHAFAICVHRLVTIKRKTWMKDAQPKNAYKRVLLQILGIWLVSAVMVAIPFLLYGRFGESIRECSFNGLFEENYIYAVAFMNAIYLTPQISMTVVYIYMSRFLFKIWHTVNPRTVLVQPTTSVTGLSSSRDTKTTDSKLDGASTSEENRNGHPTLKINTNILAKSNLPITTRYKKALAIEDNIQPEVGKQQRNSNENSQRLQRTAQDRAKIKQDYKTHRHVLVTIGLILLVTNIFMTPLNIVVLLELVNTELLTRKLKFSLVALSFMNSALNPFIYSFRIKPFKTAVRENIKKLKSCSLCK